MQEFHSILKNLILVCEFFAALIGIFFFFKLDKSFWKWFSIYLIIIFCQEFFWTYSSIFKSYRIVYFVFVGIPFQYIFLFWLFACKSFKNKNLFIYLSLFFCATIIGFSIFENIEEVYSISLNIGTIVLIILIIKEFIKQIKSDAILNFSTNKMFYINMGLILFYIGNYPFHIFGPELYKNHLEVWNIYYSYFLISNCIMYLLFSVSFIWGKTH